MFISGVITQQPLMIILALVTAYGLAWAGHFLVEHNQPAAFKRPILSFLYNFKMLWLWLNNKIDAEFEEAIKVSSAKATNLEEAKA